MPEPVAPQRDKVSILLDLRTCIGALFAVYGVVCLIWGLAFTSKAELSKSGGIHLNLWAGIGMIVVAAAFFAWTLARPIQPGSQVAGQDESDAMAMAES